MNNTCTLEKITNTSDLQRLPNIYRVSFDDKFVQNNSVEDSEKYGYPISWWSLVQNTFESMRPMSHDERLAYRKLTEKLFRPV